MNNDLYSMIFKRKSFHLFRNIGNLHISDDELNDIEKYFKSLGITERIGGTTRYETSANVAKRFFSNPNGAVVAYGANFPDGLCGGSLANAMGGPLLLAANGKTTQAAAYAKDNGIRYGAVLGGPALIDDASVRGIYQMSTSDRILVK